MSAMLGDQLDVTPGVTPKKARVLGLYCIVLFGVFSYYSTPITSIEGWVTHYHTPRINLLIHIISQGRFRITNTSTIVPEIIATYTLQ